MAARNDDHDLGGIYVTSLLSYIRRACGDEGVERLLDIAGERKEDLPGDDGWLSFKRMLALIEAATTVSGLDEIGRLVGEELYRLGIKAGVDEMMRAAGGPGEAIAMLASHGSRLAGAWTLEVTDQGPNHIEITSSADIVPDSRFFCGTGIGYYNKVPEVFGRTATAIHPECLARGDSRCRYIIRWSKPITEVKGRSFDAVGHFENLQSVATQLASADGPDEVVHLAASLAPRVTYGRRFLLVASFDGREVAAHEGFTDLDAVDTIIARVESDELEGLGDDARLCLVPLRTARREYGWMVSVHPPRSTIDWYVSRPLASFADHVASALEAALTLNTAQRDRDTAHTLVAFARDLAAITDPVEVADLLETAVVGASTAEDARVWLLDPNDQILRTIASRTASADQALIAADSLAEVAATRTVRSAEEIAKLHVGSTGIASSSVIPLMARGTVLGFLAVGWTADGGMTADEMERVKAIVDQAALAFDVAGLLADLRRQARHDPLSGLANRSLLAERAEHAMAQARRSGSHVGLLFIDLDHFKLVNDQFGHTAGDQVICEVADRLRGIVRANDTVARIGGDEFVVLLTDIGGEPAALAAARRVAEVMSDPFFVSGNQLSVSATVGVFAATPGEMTWHALLDRADAAMYAGKQSGRNAITSA